MIKTWQERLSEADYTGNELAFGVGPHKTSVSVLCMQAEIDELRSENAAQRKVLEQALEALQWEHGGEPLPTLTTAAITTIQGILK